jgi:hypothetical protein
MVTRVEGNNNKSLEVVLLSSPRSHQVHTTSTPTFVHACCHVVLVLGSTWFKDEIKNHVMVAALGPSVYR